MDLLLSVIGLLGIKHVFNLDVCQGISFIQFEWRFGFLSADGLHFVCWVFDVEGTPEPGPLLCLPESYLQRRHWAMPLLHEIRGRTHCFFVQLPCCFVCILMWSYVKVSDSCSPQLSQLVQSAVENNSLTIEPVAMSAVPMVKASAIECGGPKWVSPTVMTVMTVILSCFTTHCSDLVGLVLPSMVYDQSLLSILEFWLRVV